MSTTYSNVVAPPSTNSKGENTKILLAAGGAHLVAMALPSDINTLKTHRWVVDYNRWISVQHIPYYHI